MKLLRRQFLQLTAGVAAVPLMLRVTSALDYPLQAVRLIVPYAPGGTTDTIARQIGPWLAERFGQAFVIESRPGAGTNVGTDAVAHSAPDGNTLLLFDPSAAINATLYDKLNFNFIRDIAPIVCIFRTPLVIVVNPAVPAKTLPEFIAYAKASPGKINMASAGIGSSSQLAGELFKEMTGVEMNSHSLSRRRTRDCQSARWPGGRFLLTCGHSRRTYPRRETARAGNDGCDALGFATRDTDRW